MNKLRLGDFCDTLTGKVHIKKQCCSEFLWLPPQAKNPCGNFVGTAHSFKFQKPSRALGRNHIVSTPFSTLTMICFDWTVLDFPCPPPTPSWLLFIHVVFSKPTKGHLVGCHETQSILAATTGAKKPLATTLRANHFSKVADLVLVCC
jgi:hypothetical protein